MTDRELLARIAASPSQKAGYKQLVRELSLPGGRPRRLLLEQLDRLTVRGQLVHIDREHWSLARAKASENLVAGRLDLHRDGYGFVRPNRRPSATDLKIAPAAQDIFIPPNEINAAMQGDQVLVEVERPKADGRQQGRIVRILERTNPTVVGTFRIARADRGRENVVIPFNDRMTQPIVIPPGAEISKAAESSTPHRVLGSGTTSSPKPENPENLEGLIVDVEITSWPTATRPAIGRVIEVLGSPDEFGVDVEMMIRKHQLPRIFPEAVLAEARAVARLDPAEIAPAEIARRADFRSLPIVTIDGETARDFDDAVLVRERAVGGPSGPGFELQVHIADVSEYVRPGSALDLEARIRGTSVYFPDRAIPMLPHELSTNICSLLPNQDRLVLSCIMQLDPGGNIESFEVVEGVIRSAARMTYTEVHAIIEGDEEARSRYTELVPEFLRMKKLAVLMNKRREERGSIDFDLPEPVIEFDEQGQMRGVTRAERTWANRLIEEFMLAANECVATWLEDLCVPSLYRIHEKPDPRRVVQFEELAAGFGYSLGLGPLPVKRIQTRQERRESHGQGRNPRQHEVPEDIAVTPRMYQKLASRIEGRPEERILSYLMLRSLSQARYSEINEGHFALAAPSYTHFTSPIRRYPDLIVHRITKKLLRAGVDGQRAIAPNRLSSPWSHPNEGRPTAGVAPSFPRSMRKGLETTPAVVTAGAESRSHDARVPHPSFARVGGISVKSRIQTERVPIDPPIPEPELAEIAEETSYTERRAAEAERELVEWKKVRFMQDRVGDEFAALVLNPAKFGLFVELTDLFVEGLVPIDTMRADRFTWRENTHEIAGERSSRHYRAGDRVQVILDRALVQERKLQFALVEEELPLTGKKAAPSPSKSKKKNKRKNTSPPPPGGSKRRGGRFKKGRKR